MLRGFHGKAYKLTEEEAMAIGLESQMPSQTPSEQPAS
jgi:hypothetical protein